MKAFPNFSLFCAFVLALGSLEAEENWSGLPFDEAIRLHWTNLAIGFSYYGSDYV